MTLSNSTDFNETALQIITNSLSLLGVVAAGETVQSADVTLCMSLLNQMVKAWMAQGIHLWTEEEGTIYFVNNQAQYSLPGANSSDGSGTPVETTLASPGSGTSITVTSSTGMAVTNVIGIEINSTTMLWTTITSIVGNIIGITDALTSQAASGNQVYTYATAMPRPISIQSVRVRDEGNFDRPIWIKPRNEYMNIPQKTITGTPTVAYYSPQMNTGLIYFWPTPNAVGQRAKITYLRTIDDFDNSSDNPDLPQEWLECIVYNLAVRAAPAYGINLSSGGISGNPDILRMATQFLEDLKAWDAEQPYVKLIPNYDWRGGQS